MTIYAKIENAQIQEYPLSEYQIKARFPNVSWVIGEFDPPEGYVAVTETPRPSYDTITDNCLENMPVFDALTGWTQSWTIQTATAEEVYDRTELLASEVRTERNTRLTACDWTQLPDVTLATKSDWATYRQALRDITAQPGFPINVTWPTEPGV